MTFGRKNTCSVAMPAADVPGRFTRRSYDLDPEIQRPWLTDPLDRVVSGRTKNNQPHELLAWD
jgi:hypothetical protein